MSRRTVSQRNFIGAFLGGILGILAVGYLHPIALPFGCFIGVVIGWWHQEIYQFSANSFRRGIDRTYETLGDFTTFVVTQNIGHNIGHKAKLLAVWFLSRPIALVKCLGARPLNRALAVGILALLTYSILNSFVSEVVASQVINYLYAIALPIEIIKILILISGLMMIGAAFSVVLYLVGENQETILKMWGSSKSRWAIISRPFQFFIRVLAKIFLVEISMFFYLGAMLIWFTGIGAAFIFIVIAPISAIIGAVKAIYYVSTKTGHWLCFGTTVVVTALMALVTKPYLSDARVLWAVALLAGLTSAVATEAVRRLLVQLFLINERAHVIVAATFIVQLTPFGKGFKTIAMFLPRKLYQVLQIPTI